MILKIDSCGECPASFMDSERWTLCKITNRHHKNIEPVPTWCLLREREVKGRLLPDIEDLSHAIDFEEPKCGTCDGTGKLIHAEGTTLYPQAPELPCPDCEADGDL